MSRIINALSALVAPTAAKYTVVIDHAYDAGIDRQELDDSIQMQTVNLYGVLVAHGHRPKGLVGMVTKEHVSARCVVRLADDEAAAVLLEQVRESACEHMTVRVFHEDRSRERMGS